MRAKEKVVKANQELDAAEHEIFSRLERLYHSGDESDGAQVLVSVPPAKRPRLSEGEVGGSTPVPARRSLHFAPEPGKSPGVLVCYRYYESNAY